LPRNYITLVLSYEHTLEGIDMGKIKYRDLEEVRKLERSDESEYEEDSELEESLVQDGDEEHDSEEDVGAV